MGKRRVDSKQILRYKKHRQNQKKRLVIITVLILLILIVFFNYLGIIRKSANAKVPSESDDWFLLKPHVNISIDPPHEKHLNVRTLCQYPELPTGCEATSAVMVLDYLGEKVYLEDFANLLPCKQISIVNGRRIGDDPENYFIGSPFESAGSFGCFENVIIRVINQNFPNCHAEHAEGSLDALCSFIDSDHPVLIWATMEMQEICYATSWTLPDGSMFQWPGREHCLVLVGYDQRNYYFNDPMVGDCVVYDRNLAQHRFEEMGSRAVIISKVNP